MIHRIVQFALRQRFLILMLTVFIAVGGAISFQHMPVDAYPDLSPPMVEIITQWPGHAAEEIERLVTLPTEVEMNGVPKMSVKRSISLYGLSDVILTFNEDTDDYFARQVVFQRLSEVTYPTGVTPSLAPLSSPSGLVYRYVIESPDRTPQELKTYEDWVIEREYKQVPGVADDSGFGGTVMQYQVLLDPARLYGYHITVPQVIQQLSVNNSNAGGGFYSQGGQFYYVRGIGLLRDTADIGDVVVGSQNGVPVRVRDVGDVTIGNAPRLGEFGFNKTDDAVEGVILMLTGEQTQNVLKGVEAKTKELNENILPPDVKVRPYYDRSDLVRVTTDTVENNLLRGMVLVLIVLMFFPGELPRGGDRRADDSAGAALLVYFPARARRRGQPAFDRRHRFRNHHRRHAGDGREHLPRAGAARRAGIRFARGDPRGGEGRGPADLLFRRRDHRRVHSDLRAERAFGKIVSSDGGYDVDRAGGRADPHADVCAGDVLVLVQEGRARAGQCPFEWMRRKYAGQLDRCLDHPKTTIVLALAIFGATLLLIPFIGGEFMPHLDEGALWVRATMPYTISYEEAAKFSPQVRNILMKYPMVTDVGSELGRPDDGTDPTGFFNDEFYVGLKPYGDATWKTGPIHNKAELTEDLQKQLAAFPGVIFNFTQPAEDAVDEALTGLKSSLAVKIYGPDLNVLQDQALEIKRRLAQVPGFTELTVVRELGQPSLLIDTDRDKIARYGINVADVEAVVQAAVGGQAATQVIQGEKLFDLVVRMKPEFRENAQEIGNLLVATPSGQQIPLSELANIREASGASFIYRENNSRYIGVQYSIEGRDLESAVNEGQRAIADIQRSLPAGYRLTWGGEYSEYLEARQQMEIIGPLALLLIFMILFALYGNFKFPVTIALGVLMTEPVGALIALKLTGTPFSVSSVLGLLALMGVSVETAVILVSFINKLRQEGKDIRTATREASLLRLRPIMMTALVACLGLLPAALSTGIGSDTQKPFAIVIVAGLMSRLLLGIFVNPVLYEMVAKDGDVLQV